MKQSLINSLPDDIISRDFEAEFLKYSSYSDHTVSSGNDGFTADSQIKTNWTLLHFVLLLCLFQAWESQMWRHLWFSLPNHFFQDPPLPAWLYIFMAEPTTFWRWLWNPSDSRICLYLESYNILFNFVSWLRSTSTLKTLNHFWRKFSVTRTSTPTQSLWLKVKRRSLKRQGPEGKQRTTTEQKKKSVYPAPAVTWARRGPWWGALWLL